MGAAKLPFFTTNRKAPANGGPSWDDAKRFRDDAATAIFRWVYWKEIFVTQREFCCHEQELIWCFDHAPMLQTAFG